MSSSQEFVSSEVNDVPPDVSEIQSSKPIDFNRIARAGLVGLTLAMGVGTEAANAHEPIRGSSVSIGKSEKFAETEERKVERSLERRINEGKAKSPIYKGDIVWEDVDEGGREFRYQARIPVVAKVKQTDGKRAERYFEVTPSSDKNQKVDVNVISADARKITKVSSKNGLNGKVARYAIKVTKEGIPFIQEPTSGKKPTVRKIPISDTWLRGEGLVDRLSEGKRFVEQHETVDRLKDVKTPQEFTSVMQKYLDQYKIKLSLAPEEIAQRPTPYRVGYLRDSDLPVLKKFGFAFVDEWSKYPPGFISAIGVRNIDLANGIYKDGYKFAGMAHASEERIVLSLARNGKENIRRETIHHEVWHMAADNLFGEAGFDQGWVRLNPSGFVYDNGRGLCKESEGECKPTARELIPPGFVSEYGTNHPEEDGATVFQMMMCTAFEDLKEFATTDSVLYQKTQYLIGATGQRYPFFNERYLAEINPSKSC